MRRPAASASRSRQASGAGTAAMPGSVMPSASAIAAIVLAVPITMQVPVDGKSSPWTASRRAASSAPARCSLQTRRQAVPAPRRQPSKPPVSLGQVAVAGIELAPRLGDADERAREVLAREPGAAGVGAADEEAEGGIAVVGEPAADAARRLAAGGGVAHDRRIVSPRSGGGQAPAG